MTHVEYLKALQASASGMRDLILREIDQEGYTSAQIWCASKSDKKVALISVTKGLKRLRSQKEYPTLYTLDLDSAFIRTIAEGLDELAAGSECKSTHHAAVKALGPVEP